MAPFHPAGKQRSRGFVILWIGFLLFFPGLLNADPGGGKVLRLIFWQAPAMLNPHLSGSFKDWNASRITYEPLASFDRQGRLVPFLAAEIPSRENGLLSPDGRSVTWKLKPGIRWSDGKPFTAKDVLFTYRFVTNPRTRADSVYNYSNIDRVEMLDRLTVRIRFKTPTACWHEAFVGRNVILPRHIFADWNNAKAHEAPANKAPVGTGPYRLVRYNPEEMLMIGDDIVNMVKIGYEPNPYYRDPEKPGFDRIVIWGGGDEQDAAQSVLVDGSRDFAWNLQMDAGVLSEMEARGKGRLLILMGPDVEYINLNKSDPHRSTENGERSSIRFDHPFFADKQVRQAFAHAIDRKRIAALYGRTGRPTTNIIVSPPKYRSPHTADLYRFDLDRAARLLDAAGWRDTDGDGIRDKDGIKMRVLFQTSMNAVRQQTQNIVKQTLNAIGVEVELKYIDSSVFFYNLDPSSVNSVWHFYADMQEYYTGNRSPDPQNFLKGMTCAKIPQKANNWQGLNISRWCNPQYDAMYQQLKCELDLQKRKALIIAMNDLAVADVAAIPLVNRAMVNAVGNDLTGIELTPWDSVTWKIVEWERR